MAFFGKARSLQEQMEELERYERSMRQQMQMQQMQQQFYQSPSLGGLMQMANAPWAEVQSPVTIDPKLVESLKNAEPRKVTRRIADSVSLMTGWRAWAVTNQGYEWRLAALGQNVPWEPKKRMEASCVKGQKHPAPQKNCECGVWSFKSLDLLLPALQPYQVRVLGTVSLWGRVIETQNGFRAQYAYPKELWLLDESLEELGYIYGVPVRTPAKQPQAK